MPPSGFSESNEMEQRGAAPPTGSQPLWPWLAVLALLGALLIWRFGGLAREGAGQAGGAHSAVGKSVTELSLAPLTGEPPPASLASLDGKVTLINFWGPWCGPCNLEFPHLLELVEHFRGNADFQFISVSSNYDPHDTQGLAASTEEFLKQKNATIGVYSDPGGETQMALIQAGQIEAFGYPATVLVDRQRVIRGLWIGYQPGDERDVRRAVQAVLSP